MNEQPTPDPAKPMLRHALTAMVLLLLYAEVTALQWAGGAFDAEWGYFSDEAAHYVSGLMVRDYIASGDWSSPVRFAEQYYAHYPKIGVGNWPPLFYVFQAAWGTIFSHERISMVLFTGLQTWLLAAILFLVLKRYFGWIAAACAASVLIAMPVTQRLSGVVMADMLVALFCFSAMICFAGYARSGRWRSTVGFGVLASLAILTKGTGMLLGLLPAYCVLLSGDFRRLKQPSFYTPLGIVILCCAPWYLLTLGVATRSWTRDGWSMAYAGEAMSFLGGWLLFNLGAVLAVAAVFGVVAVARRPRKEGGRECLELCSMSLLLSILTFHLLVPNGPVERFLMPAIPAVLVLSVSGCDWLAARLVQVGPRRAAAAAGFMLLAVGGFLVQAFYIPAQHNGGFRSMVEDLYEKGDLTDSVVLVSSDVRGEGMLIAEVARLDHHARRCFVLRASKVLTVSTWDSQQQLRVLFESPEEIGDYLADVPVDFVVLDDSIAEAEAELRQHNELKSAVESDPDDWQLLGTFDRRDGAARPRLPSGTLHPDAIRVYRRIGRVKNPSRELRIDMTETLGREIVVGVGPDRRGQASRRGSGGKGAQ